MLLALVLVACDSGGPAQDEEDGRDIAQTFTVTVADTTSDYAYGDQNEIGVAYAIDGEVGRTIELERGETYEFELGDSVEGHPFYVATPPEGAPGLLYYQCDYHVYMSGDVSVVDAEGS